MARPRGGDWLDDEMMALRAAGADVLVSLLTREEEAELELLDEAAAARRAGIDFISLAVPDRGMPELRAFGDVLDLLAPRINAGEHVVVHCRMGIGRASMLAAGLLIRSGVAPDDAWARISAARGLEVPDTPEQRSWVALASSDW